MGWSTLNDKLTLKEKRSLDWFTRKKPVQRKVVKSVVVKKFRPPRKKVVVITEAQLMQFNKDFQEMKRTDKWHENNVFVYNNSDFHSENIKANNWRGEL